MLPGLLRLPLKPQKHLHDLVTLDEMLNVSQRFIFTMLASSVLAMSFVTRTKYLLATS